MDSQAFEWLASLSLSERIRALALVYSAMTVNTRQLFLPDRPNGKEAVFLDMLHGVNEIHPIHQLTARFILKISLVFS
jgi:hypothetical protein